MHVRRRALPQRQDWELTICERLQAGSSRSQPCGVDHHMGLDRQPQSVCDCGKARCFRCAVSARPFALVLKETKTALSIRAARPGCSAGRTALGGLRARTTIACSIFGILSISIKQQKGGTATFAQGQEGHERLSQRAFPNQSGLHGSDLVCSQVDEGTETSRMPKALLIRLA